jgi:hypothetical protein
MFADVSWTGVQEGLDYMQQLHVFIPLLCATVSARPAGSASSPPPAESADAVAGMACLRALHSVVRFRCLPCPPGTLACVRLQRNSREVLSALVVSDAVLATRTRWRRMMRWRTRCWTLLRPERTCSGSQSPLRQKAEALQGPARQQRPRRRRGRQPWRWLSCRTSSACPRWAARPQPHCCFVLCQDVAWEDNNPLLLLQ